MDNQTYNGVVRRGIADDYHTIIVRANNPVNHHIAYYYEAVLDVVEGQTEHAENEE